MFQIALYTCQLGYAVLVWAVGVGAPVALLLVVYLQFIQPSGVFLVETRDSNIAVEKTVAGPVLKVTRAICVPDNADGKQARIFRSVAGRDVTWLPTVDVKLQAGCHARTWSTTLPASIQPGEYEYRSVIQLQANVLRADDIPLPAIKFRLGD